MNSNTTPVATAEMKASKLLLEQGQGVAQYAPGVSPKRVKKSPNVSVESAVAPIENLDGHDPILEILTPVKSDATFKRTALPPAATREEWLKKSVALFGLLPVSLTPT